MSAFNVMSPFEAPDHKQMLLTRLMDQYSQAARRASGIGSISGAPSLLGQGPARGMAFFHPLAATSPHLAATGPGATIARLARPYTPVQGGS